METTPNSQPIVFQSGQSPQMISVPYVPEYMDPDEEELDLGQLFDVIRRRALVILGVAGVVTAAVGFWTANQTPEYQGQFRILVEPVVSDQDKFSQLSSMAGGLGAAFLQGESSGLDYDSQIEVLKSPKLIDPIVQQLQVRYPETSYKSLVGGQESPLQIDRLNNNTKIIEISYQDTDPEKILFVLSQVEKGYLRYSLEDRQSNIRQGIQFIDDQLPQLRQRVDTLQEQLQEFRQQTNLIEPSVQGEQLAEQMTKVNDQLLEAQTAVEQGRELVINLREQLGQEPEEAIALSVLSEAPGYQELLRKLQELEQKIYTESTRFKPESPQIQVLLEQRNKLLPLLRKEAQAVLGQNLGNAAVTPESFPFQSTVRLELTQQMVDAFNKFELAKLRYSAIAQAANALQQQLNEFPAIVRQYTDLQRELQVASNTLNELLARREGLRVDAAQKEVPWEIIAKPEIPKNEEGELVPVSPKVLRNLVLGAMLGLMLGFGAALLVERLDNVFHDPDDLKDVTRVPLLGTIPASDSAKELPIADRDRAGELYYPKDFPFTEAFRTLHANLRFLNPNKSIRSLVIGSAPPAEGKSTVAVNLAQAAAAMGQRVLLVDADLRWPQVHTRLGIENRKGLSHILAKNVEVSEAIARSPVEENLYLLTAGALTPDPTRLLSSDKMQQLMQQWESSFDLVIYDTPPLLGVVDARLLAANTDGLALVVSIGETERPAVARAIEELQKSNINVLGTIGNGVKGSTNNFYYDSQRYDRYNGDRESLEEEEPLPLEPS
jgi:capsular exopolysaccharide synthesis family protein